MAARPGSQRFRHALRGIRADAVRRALATRSRTNHDPRSRGRDRARRKCRILRPPRPGRRRRPAVGVAPRPGREVAGHVVVSGQVAREAAVSTAATTAKLPRVLLRVKALVVAGVLVAVAAAGFWLHSVWIWRGFAEYRMVGARDIPTAIAVGSDGAVWFTIDFS